MTNGDGASRAVGSDDWRTPAERSDYATTPDLAETRAYLERLREAHPGQLAFERFGTSGQGRPLDLVLASTDGVVDPVAVRASGRVVLLVQNAIHAGEMDGKDACLALLRDLLRVPGNAALLDRVVLAIIPVYNVDGHERRLPFQRINQNGPEVGGWRANATNLNLNRDYLKAEAPETRAFLAMLRRWQPDFFVDNHVTDGADFEYDVTFAVDSGPDVDPALGRWVRENVAPEIVAGVGAAGHLAFPGAVFLNDATDPARGLAFNENPPRFSTGRMILENRPGLLVELHMLKDYRTRVTGNYALLRTLLAILNRDAAKLRSMNREADAAASQLGARGARGEPFPLVVEGDGTMTPTRFRGVAYRREASEVSGADRIIYGQEPHETTVPVGITPRVGVSVVPPVGYIVPPQWTAVIDVLEVQGVELRRTREEWTGPVGLYRCSGMEWPSRPFEGRRPILRVGNVEGAMGRFGTCQLSETRATFPGGSAVVPLDQRRSKVAVHWLEPEGPDSALRWGFFDPIFEAKESGEEYVVEKLARDALADPGVRAAFEERLGTDPSFASSPSRRLGFFYERSPWGRANRVGQYPVGRLRSLEGLPF